MTLRLRLALAVALLAASPVTRAQTATVTHASALREHPDNSARSIMEVHRRASVRILETRRDWIKVEADGLRSGWLPERDLDIGAGEAFVTLQTPPAPPAAIELPRVQPRARRWYRNSLVRGTRARRARPLRIGPQHPVAGRDAE